MTPGKYIRTPEIREKLRAHRLGKKHSPDTIEKIRAAGIGRPHKNKYTEHYADWIRLYKSGMKAREIASQYGCSVSNVAFILSSRGVPTHNKKHSKYYSMWAELYASGKSAPCIASEFNCNVADVLYGVQKMNVKTRDMSHAHREYELDETFFDVIDTINKAYWLGFISADGTISSRPDQNQLTIALSARDADRIYEFLLDIKSNITPSFYNANGGKCANIVRINVANQSFVNALKGHKVTPRKSLTLEFCNDVPPNLLHSYIRGYFDGDGSIYFDKNKKPYFAIVGTVPFLKRVQSILISELKLNETKIRSKGKISELRYSGTRNVLKIKNWLYQDDGPKMQRKKDRFESIG